MINYFFDNITNLDDQNFEVTYKKRVIREFNGGIFYETEDDFFINLKNFILNFKIEDVIQSIFIINSWLPNKSSTFKSYILNQILLNLTEEESKLNFRINTYKKFKFFTKKIQEYMPEFNYYEDYIPEGDKNEIKYYYNNKNYSVFYGGNYSNLYEYYYLFEIMYLPSKDLFLDNMNPHNIFAETLNYIENIIKITSDYNEIKNLIPGYFEVPSSDYYLNITRNFKYISSFISNDIFTLDQVQRIEKCKNIEEVISSFNNGMPLSLSLKYKDSIFPLFSRDPIARIINIYEKQAFKVDQYTFYKNIKLGIANFIDIRFNKECLKLIQPIISEKNSYKKNDLIYDFMFICDDEIFLFFTSEIKDLDILNIKIENERKKIIENKFVFADHLERQNIQIKGPIKKINFYNIYLKSDFTPELIKEKNFNFKIIFLNELIYIFDEIEKLEEFKEFNSYMERETEIISVSKLDIFANFKMGHGEILHGAEDPHLLMLSGSSSDEFRYNSLKLLWQNEEYIDYGHPKEWDIKARENGVVDLLNKNSGDFSSSIKIGNTIIRVSLIENQFYTSDIKEIGHDLQSILIEYFFKFKYILETDEYFTRQNNILIKIIPEEILKDSKFKHLLHLKDSTKKWNSDFTRLNFSEYGIRILFNTLEISKILVENKTKSFELDFFISIISYFNLKKVSEILFVAEKIKNEPNRIRRVPVESTIIRDNIYEKFEVEDKFYIKIRKEMAILLKQKGITPGKYIGKESLEVLYNIRKIITEKLLTEILVFDKSLILFFLEKLEKLFFYNKMVGKHHNEELYFDEFDRYIKENKEFMFSHKIFTIIIENKLYQNIYGEKKINENDAKYLYALSKWLLDVFTSIDFIYYSINEELYLIIEDNMLFSVENPKYIQDINDNWFKQMTNMTFSGSDLNGILSKKEMNDFFDRLDIEFKNFYQFTITNIFEVLYALYLYRGNDQLTEEISEEEIISYLKECYPEIESKYFRKVINYLTLDPAYLGSVLREDKLIEKGFIPYDEINKRPYRLIIKPLIKIETKFYFTRELMSRSHQTYYRHILNGKLPYRNENNKIQTIIDSYAKQIQDKIVYKTIEIAQKVGYESGFIFREVDLRTFDKEGKHPRLDLLGDYDILLFDIQKKIVFNIECKYISQDFCAKDLKNTMEQIFGRKGSSRKYYIQQFLKRQNYLDSVIKDVVNRKFDIHIDEITVIPIFLTYTTNMYLKHPPIDSNIIYLTINEFEEYLVNIHKDI